ncbi:Arc family DNA-binding protein [Bacillus sonorensis]|uniref:Arc family DNA-binding protein n=1 Tax=Bacillus sonorensis TaxID=119858 RepID=UPI001B2A5163|nr:Arc family DNA-binding protein [Bacillus sonorensis]MCF7618686.1 Arc family DNA-binding protein [Bacillus sonorensis]MCY7858907.1 Arc family DNA-binding protein [Bacillus sonorensis]MCY8034019.1 Arc family DNA-binding protein [Bacillus sonorensis]MCY8564551.1 Arc family DNA-binding protein [Bacillus sonorensis]GIN67547.1 hypothetical protein J41TS2_29680 [Bacillus sonorensis]
MSKEIERMTLRLPKELHSKLVKEADDNMRSLNGQIVHILKEFMDNQNKEDTK